MIGLFKRLMAGFSDAEPKAPPTSAAPMRPTAPLMPMTPTALTEGTRLRQNLRQKFLGNDQAIERVIEFQRKRQPHATVEVLMLAAIEEWERDNR